MQQRKATDQLAELLFLFPEFLCSKQAEIILIQLVVVVLSSAKYTPM
jgi:hypothetical protein